jgi:hypothetical protein
MIIWFLHEQYFLNYFNNLITNVCILSVANLESVFQLGKKINHCHTYYSYKVDLDLSALDQPKLVDGYKKLVKNFV